MRHRKAGRQLSRVAEQRRALMANLATSIVLHDQVVTTEAKAKEIRRFLEPLITRAAKGGSVPTVRRLSAALPERRAVTKLVKDLGPKYKERPGGYLRLTKLGQREGDGARRVKVELV
jgi:large subunit ribosomal protein L17